MTRFHLPDDYWDTYAHAIRAIGVADVSAQANRVLQPDNLVWIVVGDRVRIEEKIRALGLGEMRFLDADGNPVDGQLTFLEHGNAVMTAAEPHP